MKMTRFGEPQILAMLRQAESGAPVPELCREHGMSTGVLSKWRAKYGGMDASIISQMKSLDPAIGVPSVQARWRGRTAG